MLSKPIREGPMPSGTFHSTSLSATSGPCHCCTTTRKNAHQMKITVKKVALFLVACVVAGWAGGLWMQSDRYHAEVIKFVKNDQQVITHIGSISSAKLVGITSVQSSISRDDKFTPGYDLYRVNVRGERSSVRVTVVRKASQNGSSNFRVGSID